MAPRLGDMLPNSLRKTRAPLSFLSTQPMCRFPDERRNRHTRVPPTATKPSPWMPERIPPAAEPCRKNWRDRGAPSALACVLRALSFPAPRLSHPVCSASSPAVLRNPAFLPCRAAFLPSRPAFLPCRAAFLPSRAALLRCHAALLLFRAAFVLSRAEFLLFSLFPVARWPQAGVVLESRGPHVGMLAQRWTHALVFNLIRWTHARVCAGLKHFRWTHALVCAGLNHFSVSAVYTHWSALD